MLSPWQFLCVPMAQRGPEAQGLLLEVPCHGISLPLVTPTSLLDIKESCSGVHGLQCALQIPQVVPVVQASLEMSQKISV